VHSHVLIDGDILDVETRLRDEDVGVCLTGTDYFAGGGEE